MLVERVGNLVVRFFVSVWVIRYLGPTDYGIYSYAISLTAIIAGIATLGLDSIVVRDLSRDVAPARHIVTTALTLYIVGAVVATAVTVIIALVTENDNVTRLAVMIASAQLLFQPANVFDLWFQARIKSKYPVIARSIATIASSALQIILVVRQASLTAFMWVVVAHAVFTALGLYSSFRLRGPGFSIWPLRLTGAKALLHDAWPLLIVNLSILVYVKIDQIMLGNMADSSLVGEYSVAIRLSEIWYFVPVAIGTSLLPGVVRARTGVSAVTYRDRMQAFYDVMAIISYVVAIPMTLLAAPLINLLFGGEYQNAAEVLKIHIWAFIFVSLGVARGRWLIAEGLMKFSMFATVLGALVNVAMNVWLIPNYGGTGAAWATLVSYAVSGYFSCLLHRPLLPVFVQMTKSLFVPLRLAAFARQIRFLIDDRRHNT